MDAFKAVLSKKATGFLVSHRAFCEKALQFQPGDRGIITNGKVSLCNETINDRYTSVACHPVMTGVQ